MALFDGNANEDKVCKTFVALPQICQHREVPFGDGGDAAKKISSREVLGLLALAAGARVVGKEGSWVHTRMRSQFELCPGKESDGEEDGPEDGP